VYTEENAQTKGKIHGIGHEFMPGKG
jgi:hypothetical protein